MNDVLKKTLPCLLAVAAGAVIVHLCWPRKAEYGATTEPVGSVAAGRSVTPVNQILTPAGQQVELPKVRPQALALSPDGRLLVTAGKTPEIIVLNPADGTLRQRVALPSSKDNEPRPEPSSDLILNPDKDGQLSYTGLIFSPDGRRIYLSNVNGSIKVFHVAEDGKVSPLHSLALPESTAPGRKQEIPSGLALSKDGAKLYVCLNLSNSLAEIDTASGKVLRTFPVGVAPYDVVVRGGRAWVTNWAGRRPKADSQTGSIGRGTVARVDPVRGIASEGSVSVIDLVSGHLVREIMAGLHASALALSPDGKHLVVANSGIDTLTVIDTAGASVVTSLSARLSPAEPLGAQPNALAFSADGRKLYVANGTQNAVGVIEWDGDEPEDSKLEGLIPTGWFPGAVVADAREPRLYVANIKGPGSGKRLQGGEAVKFNTHQYLGSVSLIPLPDAAALKAHTAQVLANNRAPVIATALLPARPFQSARPVPERTGEPSLIKHVVYVIKENRTYDQVLGDMPEGRGDPALCIYGEKVTPNHHALAREFVLLDNTYCSGILSADGHNWAASGIATEYLERSFAGFPRSYPDNVEEHDVLSAASTGFIWDHCQRFGVSFLTCGEGVDTTIAWADPERKGKPGWLDVYRDWQKKGGACVVKNEARYPSLTKCLAPTPGWHAMISDSQRAAAFRELLAGWEKAGNMPAMTILYFPMDHTSGTAKNKPTPSASVADNDLALGQSIEALSRSKFWGETAVFCIEDDPQNGWDHVSGYRTISFVASPWTRKLGCVSTQYNQTSLLRTMELILGLPPMNQMDASATPMFDCFAGERDLTPYVCRANQVPIDQMNPGSEAVADARQREDALASDQLPLDEPDRCDEDQLNRILWRAAMGPAVEYPAWAAGRDED